MRGSWLLGAALIVAAGAAVQAATITVSVQPGAGAAAIIEGIVGDVTAEGHELTITITIAGDTDAAFKKIVVLTGSNSRDFVSPNDLAGGGSETHALAGGALTTTTDSSPAASAGATGDGAPLGIDTTNVPVS